MKSLSVFRLLGLLALLIGLAGVPVYGQDQQPASQDPAAQSQSPPDQQEPAPQSQSPSDQQQQQPAAQSEPPQQEPGAQSQDSESSQQSAQSQPTQIFVGKVAKSKGGLMLKGDTGMSYKLDNEDQAKPFVGKRVKVTGKLDAATNTIHVTNIEPASSS